MLTRPSDECEPRTQRQEPSVPLDHQTPIHDSGLRGEAAIHEEHEGLRVTAACDIGRSRPTRFHPHLVRCHEQVVLARHGPSHRKVTAQGHQSPCVWLHAEERHDPWNPFHKNREAVGKQGGGGVERRLDIPGVHRQFEEPHGDKLLGRAEPEGMIAGFLPILRAEAWQELVELRSPSREGCQQLVPRRSRYAIARWALNAETASRSRTLGRGAPAGGAVSPCTPLATVLA